MKTTAATRNNRGLLSRPGADAAPSEPKGLSGSLRPFGFFCLPVPFVKSGRSALAALAPCLQPGRFRLRASRGPLFRSVIVFCGASGQLMTGGKRV